MLHGRFTYREAGILDSTHLRFFTPTEVERLFASAGLEGVGLPQSVVRRFSTTTQFRCRIQGFRRRITGLERSFSDSKPRLRKKR